MIEARFVISIAFGVYAGRPTDAKKEKAPKRTFGNRLAGSSENIRPAVAFLRSAIFLIKQLFER